MITNFRDLNAWKEAHVLILGIYKITKNFPKDETFGLTSQLRRAVVSIESCIAEGFSRYTYKDRIHFYYESRGSLSEVQSQSITAKDLGYIDEKDLKAILEQSEKVSLILGGLIRSTAKLAIKK